MIVVVGESLVDLVDHVDPGGPSVEASPGSPGGSPYNVAIGLGRLGVPVTLVTEIAEDDRGDLLTTHAFANGVDLRAHAPAGGRATATATARLDAAGVASYDFDLGWDLPAVDLPPCDLLHVGSLGALLEPGCVSVMGLVEEAVAAGVPVSYDPNLRADFLGDADLTRSRVRALAERCTIVKLSDEDLELLAPGVDPLETAQSLPGPATELVVVTRGPAGAVAYAGSSRLSVPAPGTEVVDTVGAGDAFTSALLAQLHERVRAGERSLVPLGRALEEILRTSARAASLCCARAGANPPWPSELSSDHAPRH